MFKIIKLLSYSILLMSILNGCGIYSFTGASIPAEAKTVSIKMFENKASLVEPTLAQALTDELKDKFVSQTTLDLVSQNGDLQIEGEITGYSTKPIAIQGDQTAAMNRLTINIKVKFINLFDETKDFDSSFSRYQDYSSEQDLGSVQAKLIDLINEALVDDIFNRAVVNW
jgi:hypothetical protein